ncbi:MAG TPA: sigma-70 family RNA polymerase sigma factor [Planctomycetota bacterium]|nr:sigma-70 family RNA polymerase sigma factor [Planctomycetota bacterium]
MTDDRQDLLQGHRPRLLAYLLHLVRDPHDAEDLLQELSVVVLQKPDMLTRAGDVFAYLRGVARHLAAGRLGARMRSNDTLRRWTEWAWENDPDDGTTDDDRARQIEALRKCREKLPETSRRMVVLRYDRGLDIRDVAGQVGSTVGAIKVALLRIRVALARCVQGRLREETAT